MKWCEETVDIRSGKREVHATTVGMGIKVPLKLDNSHALDGDSGCSIHYKRKTLLGAEEDEGQWA